MTASLISPNSTVAETLRSDTDVSHVFIARKTACVGCYLAGFCTLEDVAKTYQLPLDEFLSELEEASHANHTPLIGAQNG
jgi:hypothetical protein